jgi:hypothetical protein
MKGGDTMKKKTALSKKLNKLLAKKSKAAITKSSKECYCACSCNCNCNCGCGCGCSCA